MVIRRVLRVVAPAGDWIIAVVLAGVGQVELWINPFLGSRFEGPPAANAAFLLLVSIPFGWRRRAPVAVVVLVVSASFALYTVMYGAGDQGPIEPFLALLLAAYTLGAQTQGRRAAAAATVAAVLIIVGDVRGLLAGRSLGDTLPAWVLYVGLWALGRALRGGQARAAALETHASRLEREQEERARTAVADERARIARELHDVIAHSLSVIVVQAAAERRVAAEQESTRDVLLAIEQAGREALVELRRLLGILRKNRGDPSLLPQPSLGHIDALVEHVRGAGASVEVRIEGEVSPLPPGVDVSAYRIVQEALTNVLKHAGAARAEVVIRYGRRDIELEVRDDGRGPVNEPGDGHGLIGMRERVAVYGGVIEAGRRDGGGYELRVRLPLHQS
jgi:signal transduction histidine kinase